MLDRKLVVVDREAETVRFIFRRYTELGSVRLLKRDLDQRSRARKQADGATIGGQSFSRGALYTLLRNPIYIGDIGHKGMRYSGQHEAILACDIWEAAEAQLQNSPPRAQPATPAGSPLLGKLFDEAGQRLTPSQTTKAGRRYRYYISGALATTAVEDVPGAWRLPAAQIETHVAAIAADMICDKSTIAAMLERAGVEPRHLPAALEKADRLCKISSLNRYGTKLKEEVIERVELSSGRLRIVLSVAPLMPQIAESDRGLCLLARDVPLCLKRRGVETRLILDGPGAKTVLPDPMLLKEVARAHRCFDALVSGRARSVADLATREGISDRYLSSVLDLVFWRPRSWTRSSPGISRRTSPRTS